MKPSAYGTPMGRESKGGFAGSHNGSSVHRETRPTDEADFELRVLSRIQIVIEMPHKTRCEAPNIAAYVTRSTKGGVGIEWCEFSPGMVGELLAGLAARPYVRLRKPENAPTVAIARLSMPLLKHGT
jgi:hypothetical protein